MASNKHPQRKDRSKSDTPFTKAGRNSKLGGKNRHRDPRKQAPTANIFEARRNDRRKLIAGIVLEELSHKLRHHPKALEHIEHACKLYGEGVPPRKIEHQIGKGLGLNAFKQELAYWARQSVTDLSLRAA